MPVIGVRMMLCLMRYDAWTVSLLWSFCESLNVILLCCKWSWQFTDVCIYQHKTSAVPRISENLVRIFILVLFYLTSKQHLQHEKKIFFEANAEPTSLPPALWRQTVLYIMFSYSGNGSVALTTGKTKHGNNRKKVWGTSVRT